MGRPLMRHLEALDSVVDSSTVGVAACGRFVARRRMLPLDQNTTRRWEALVSVGRACRDCDRAGGSG